MPLAEAIRILEEMYLTIDEEAEKLEREDRSLALEARTDRRALAVAIENLHFLADAEG
jgi:hypothetical protein